MSAQKQGFIAMIAACTIWGLSPIYYKLLVHIPSYDLLAHRTFWSFFVFAGLLAFQGRFGQLRLALATPRSIAITVFAALMVTTNWFLFIVSVQIDKVTESSLGYYIFPIIAVVMGVGFLSERLTRLQWLAVVLVVVAVVQLTVGLGAAPWISLVLAVTFSLYGLVKKHLAVGPTVSVTAEVSVLLPIAVCWLVMQQWQGKGVFGYDVVTSVLLVFSGVLTALPLIFFTMAAKRLNMVTLGLMQYINPTLQFLCATVIFSEPFGVYHRVAFGLIWLALALYTLSGYQREKALRNSVIAPSAVSAD